MRVCHTDECAAHHVLQWWIGVYTASILLETLQKEQTVNEIKLKMLRDQRQKQTGGDSETDDTGHLFLVQPDWM